MTFSASLDMGGGQTLDVGDFELDTQDMGTDDNASVAIGVSGVNNYIVSKRCRRLV
jgi:hypothetical protein